MTDFNVMYDYIVIGAGSAGCIVASKLASAKPDANILLIEAGKLQLNPKMYHPSNWFQVLQHYPAIDWGYKSEIQSNLANRRIMLAQGKALGGSALLNATVYVRGSRSDFDNWNHVASGWSWDDVNKHFDKVEEIMRPVDGIKDSEGFIDALFAAASENGLSENADYNDGDQYGYAAFKFNNINIFEKMFRETSYSAFLPAMHTNVTVQTEALVTKIRFQGTKAIGVEYYHKNTISYAGVHEEIVMSAGAFATPKILMLSGIGEQSHLETHNIPVVHSSRNVGKNLHDDLFVSVGYKIETGKDVPVYDYSLAPAVLFGKTNSASTNVDIVTSVGVGTLKGFMGEPRSYWLWPNVMKAKSKGRVRLRSSSPDDPPIIDPNYMSEASDLDNAVLAMKFGMQIAQSNALRAWRGDYIFPNPDATDEQLKGMIETTADTTQHYCGTCGMGDDDTAVVDRNMRVRGVDKLRVMDASVIPVPITANTAAATMMLAHRGADLIIKNENIPDSD